MATRKITRAYLDHLRLPETGQTFIWDSTLKGFGVRLSPSTASFIAEGRVAGRTRRITLGRYPALTVPEARQEARKTLGAMAKGRDPNAEKQAAKAKQVTLATAFADFMASRKGLKAHTLRDYQRVMNTALAGWRGRPWTSITGTMVARQHTLIGSKHGEAFANLSMRVLRAVLNFAAETYRGTNGERLTTENPVKRLSVTKAWYRIDRRTRVIKPHQLPAWWAAVDKLENETVRDYLRLILLTGLRRSEAMRLKWSEIDFTDRSLIVRDTKNSQPLALPLSDYLLTMLKARKAKADSDYVFPGNSASGVLAEPKRPIAEVVQTSGVPFTVHDLRRTFITIAESLDIGHYTLKALLNHRSNAGDVTGGYIQINTERLRTPMQKITDYILSAAKVKTSNVVALTNAM